MVQRIDQTSIKQLGTSEQSATDNMYRLDRLARMDTPTPVLRRIVWITRQSTEALCGAEWQRAVSPIGAETQ